MSKAIFKRRTVLVKPTATVNEVLDSRNTAIALQDSPEPKVLVINASREMAKEMTLQLTLKMPGCSIMYAPSLSLAKWILERHAVDLIVSSPLLPDGGISKLQGVLSSLAVKPDLVVFGDMTPASSAALSDYDHEVLTLRRIRKSETSLDDVGRPEQRPPSTEKVDRKISSVGADLRNDLNNPLQEIVAMVFVAQATGGELSPSTREALAAIDQAAKNMAQVVGQLEDKIRTAVHS